MATTATKIYQTQLGGKVVQVWSWTIGASDTVMSFPTGLYNIDALFHNCTAQEINGKLVLNSNDGTAATLKGGAYISGLANSETGVALVIGS